MGKVLIERENLPIGILAAFIVYIDGERVNKIYNGQILKLNVTSGKHEIYFRSSLNFIYTNKIYFESSPSSVTRIIIKGSYVLSGIFIKRVSTDNELNKKLDNVDALTKLCELKEKKIISKKEFEEEKNRILKGE